MQKWDYLYVRFHLEYGVNSGYVANGKRFRQIFKGSKDEDPIAKFKYQLLNEWGAQGWELVTATASEQDELIFKRPK